MDPSNNPDQLPKEEAQTTTPVQNPGKQVEQQTPLAANYNTPIPDAPKRTYHPKRFIVALSIFVVVCILAVVSLFALASLPSGTTKSKTSLLTKEQVISGAKPLTAEVVISHVKEYFKGESNAKQPLLRPVQAPNETFFTVVPEVEPLVSVAGEVERSQTSSQIASIIHSLEDDNLIATTVSDGTNGADYKAYFTSKDVTCELDQLNPEDTKANSWIEAKCLDSSVYSSYATAQLPLVSLYTPLSATSLQYGFVGKPVTTAAGTTGYNKSSMQVSSVINNQFTSNGTVALYYQTPEGIWHYFTDQDNGVLLGCDKFSTPDLKSVYANEPCRGSSGQASTVTAPRKAKR